MAILETTIKRFIGDSSDVKPALGKQVANAANEDAATVTSRDLPAGSTFFEEDTGDIWRWNGVQWTLPARDYALQDEMLEQLKAIRRELVQMRLGMMETAMCAEVNHEESY